MVHLPNNRQLLTEILPFLWSRSAVVGFGKVISFLFKPFNQGVCMGEVIRLFEESKLLEEIADTTVTLIHATRVVPAIKMLVSAHDIIHLNLEISRLYPTVDGSVPWDRPAFNDLDRIRHEVTFRYGEQLPSPLLPGWYGRLGFLFLVLNLGLENKGRSNVA